MPTEAAELVFDEATKVYPGRDGAAVDHLSLTVPAGEICVLVGPSGCGKTTTLKLVNRLIPLTSGYIRIDGRQIGTGAPGPLTRKLRDLYWASHQDPRYSTPVRY